jgi:hypothetical protein
VALDFKPLLTALVDMGADSYETRVRRLILQAGLVLLVLILVWKKV